MTTSARFEDSRMRAIHQIVLATAGGGGTHAPLLSRRENARALREVIDQHISLDEAVELDCARTEATQSYMDELVGVLVLERGPEVLKLLRFRRCSADMKAIIRFVVDDRAAQHKHCPHFHAPR